MKTGTSPGKPTGFEDKPDAALEGLEKILSREVRVAQGVLARVRKEMKRRSRHG